MSHSMPACPNSDVIIRNGSVARARGGVRDRRPDVRADQFGRQQQAGPALDGLALHGVGAVRAPDAVGAGQRRQVGPRTPGRAGLDLQPGCRARSSSSSRCSAAVWAWAPGRPACTGSDRSRLWSHLIASSAYSVHSASIWPRTCAYASGFARSITCWCRAARGSRPGAASTQSGWARATSESREIISGSNHSPNCMPRPRTWSTSGCRPCGPHVRVDHPVAQAAGVVAAAEEPAVVEHEALDAHRGGAVGEAREPVEVVVEVDGLPDVERQRRGASDG